MEGDGVSRIAAASASAIGRCQGAENAVDLGADVGQFVVADRHGFDAGLWFAKPALGCEGVFSFLQSGPCFAAVAYVDADLIATKGGIVAVCHL